ncbi:dephospho-CoA kinase [Thalassotalea crassostreae]|uniref:dephospho-CoA kinase n=1 Tax=Thalassotalea crassostreae TaxID=1763536 RepID=UPI0008388D47|nr:dephospho-CoA kinase [Thalassotalea crassostreae]
MSDLVIGLTGGIGSGKTTIANMFAEYGVDIIDADIVAREVVAIGSVALAQIAEHFGKDFLLADGNLDRTKLRHRVFANEQDKQWLNALLHPLIRDTMQQQCEAAKSPYCFLVAPLLIENGINKSVDKVLVVDVLPETQISRTVKRDNNTVEQVQKILDAQVTREKRLAHADFVVDNNGTDIELLKPQIEDLHRQFIKLLANK